MLNSYINLELIAIWTILILPIYECGDFLFDFQWFAYNVSRYGSLYIDSTWVLLSLLNEYTDVFKKFGKYYPFFLQILPLSPILLRLQSESPSYDCGLVIWVGNGSLPLLTTLPRLSQQVTQVRMGNADILPLLGAQLGGEGSLMFLAAQV